MGLSMAEAKMLGLAHLHPDARRKAAPADDAADDPLAGANKTERAFAAALDLARREPDLIRGWWFEPFRLRLAGRTTLRIDFLVDVYAGRPCVVETKGHMRDDAAVKLKVAAEKFTCFRWLLVMKDDRGWEVREVTRNGIGRKRISVAWIYGS